MKSLYGQYVEERLDLHIIESEHGFVTYELTPPTCYIADIFVSLGSRRTGLAREMCLRVGDIAREAGCRQLFGSVDPKGKTATEGMQLILGMGMRLASIQNGLIFFVLEL